MAVSEKRLPPSSLTIAAKKSRAVREASIVYKLSLPEEKPLKKKELLEEPDSPPFEKWMMPPQEDGYIKARNIDLL
jgi:hypothetical protein